MPGSGKTLFAGAVFEQRVHANGDVLQGFVEFLLGRLERQSAFCCAGNEDRQLRAHRQAVVARKRLKRCPGIVAQVSCHLKGLIHVITIELVDDAPQSRPKNNTADFARKAPAAFTKSAICAAGSKIYEITASAMCKQG